MPVKDDGMKDILYNKMKHKDDSMKDLLYNKMKRCQNIFNLFVLHFQGKEHAEKCSLDVTMALPTH